MKSSLRLWFQNDSRRLCQKVTEVLSWLCWYTLSFYCKKYILNACSHKYWNWRNNDIIVYICVVPNWHNPITKTFCKVKLHGRSGVIVNITLFYVFIAFFNQIVAFSDKYTITSEILCWWLILGRKWHNKWCCFCFCFFVCIYLTQLLALKIGRPM